MSDALVTPPVAATMAVASFAAAAFALKKLKAGEEHRQLPLMAILGAFVFAIQMINFSIPGTGASGHLTGGLLLSALLGPYAGFVTMIAILVIQCLLFADGGLLALGCNIWNMAFYGCFVGAVLIWQFIVRNEVSRKKIILASILGSVVTLQLGAFSVVAETVASGISELPFRLFLSVMQPIHLAIGLVEGVITASILCFVYEVRPELIWDRNRISDQIDQKSKKSWVYGFFIAFVVSGACLTLFASSAPDGLEWSVGQVARGNISSSSTGVSGYLEKFQHITSLLPDYSFKNSDGKSGTSFSGLLGGIIVMGVLYVGNRLLRLFFKRK